MSDWFDKEEEALQKQLDRGEITFQQYQREVREMRRDLAREEYESAMRGAGRGHLVRS